MHDQTFSRHATSDIKRHQPFNHEITVPTFCE
jgi:hypothetical protein